jgi:hypothetical protein
MKFCRGDGVVYYLDYILLNPVASVIPKSAFYLLRSVRLLNQSVDWNEILYGNDDVKDDIDVTVLNLVASMIP